MTPYQIRRLFGNGGGRPNTGPLAGKKATNVPPFNYYSGVYPWVNIMLVSNGFDGVFGGTGTLNNDGWITGLSVGASTRATVALDMSSQYGWFPIGNYKIVSASAATLSVLANTYITNIVSGVGVCTFTVTAVPDGGWNGLSVIIDAKNNTASPIDVLSCAAYLVSEEAQYQADVWAYKTSFKEDLLNCASLRFMDWTNTNGQSRYTLSQYGSQVRGGQCGYRRNGVPFAHCVKLAKDMSTAAWICTPQASKQINYSYTAATSTFTAQSDTTSNSPKVHNFSNGERLMSFTYDTANTAMAPLSMNTPMFVVNATPTTFQLATTSGGAPVSLTAGIDRNQAAFSYAGIASLDTDIAVLAAQIATSCYAESPDTLIVCEQSNEVWNFAFSQFRYATNALGYVATGNIGNFIGAGYAYSCLKTWKGWESVYPASSIIRVVAGQCVYFESMADAAFDYVDPGIISPGSTLKSILSSSVSRSMYAVAPYIVGNNGTVARPTYEQIYADNGNSEVIPDSYWDTCFRRGFTECINGATSSVTKSRAKVPGILVSCYEYGVDWFLQNPASTHGVAIGTSGINWLNSLAGKTMYQDAYFAIVVGGGLQHINQYFNSGGQAATSTLFSSWGLKPRQGDANDTPRSSWFKSL